MSTVCLSLLACVVLGIGMLGICGHVFHMRMLHAWGGAQIGMAFSTACAFIAIGVALLLVAQRDVL